jgi:hypothetical protein
VGFDGDVVDQRIVVCEACGRAYTARRRPDGTYILPTADGQCGCGSERFGEFGAGEAAERPPS